MGAGAGCAAFLLLLALPLSGNAGVPADFGPSSPVSIRGYLQNQTGVFISTDEDEEKACDRCTPKQDFPSNHGGKLGQLSMLRNTLKLEMDWWPLSWLSMHVGFRGTLSPLLEADDDAQPPHISGKDPDDHARRKWVADTYYNRADLHEVYLDIDPADILSFRVGRQLIPWGETGGARLLDVVNPVDASWHFAALESYEDIRIPQWSLKGLLEIPSLGGGLEAVWVPMVPYLEREEDTVTVPLTFVGAWGLPMPPQQGDVSIMPRKIEEKHFLYPRQHPDESRVGVRWKGELGDHFGYTLMYWYGHQVSPPVPVSYVTKPYQGIEVDLEFPRVHVAGFALETNLPFPISTMFRLEGSIEPDRVYPVHSLAPRPQVIDDLGGSMARFYFTKKKKLTMQYALTIQQGAIIRALNPTSPVIIAIQFKHTMIPGLVEASAADCGRGKGDCILDIPGYDSTLSKEHQFQLGGAVFSSYLYGLLTPKISWAWLHGGGGFVSGSLTVAPDEHWQLKLALSELFGADPYYSVGFFRDRDEVNLRVRYQF